MVVTVEAHHRMVRSLVEAHGEEVAATMVQQLAPHDLATRGDFDAFRSEMAVARAEAASARAQSEVEWSRSRAQMHEEWARFQARVEDGRDRSDAAASGAWAAFRSEVRADHAQLGDRLEGAIDGLHHEVRGLRHEVRGVRTELYGAIGEVDRRHQWASAKLGLWILISEGRLGARIDGVEDRLGGVEGRLGERINGVEDRLGGMEEKLGARIGGVEDKLDRSVRWLVGGWASVLLALVGIAVRAG